MATKKPAVKKAATKKSAPKKAPAKKVAAKKAVAPKKPKVPKGTLFPTTHGGARAGAGRDLVSDEKMIVISFRGTAAHKAKMERLGGAEWVRARIDAATVSTGK